MDCLKTPDGHDCGVGFCASTLQRALAYHQKVKKPAPHRGPVFLCGTLGLFSARQPLLWTRQICLFGLFTETR